MSLRRQNTTQQIPQQAAHAMAATPTAYETGTGFAVTPNGAVGFSQEIEDKLSRMKLSSEQQKQSTLNAAEADGKQQSQQQQQKKNEVRSNRDAFERMKITCESIAPEGSTAAAAAAAASGVVTNNYDEEDGTRLDENRRRLHALYAKEEELNRQLRYMRSTGKPIRTGAPMSIGCDSEDEEMLHDDGENFTSAGFEDGPLCDDCLEEGRGMATGIPYTVKNVFNQYLSTKRGQLKQKASQMVDSYIIRRAYKQMKKREINKYADKEMDLMAKKLLKVKRTMSEAAWNIMMQELQEKDREKRKYLDGYMKRKEEIRAIPDAFGILQYLKNASGDDAVNKSEEERRRNAEDLAKRLAKAEAHFKLITVDLGSALKRKLFEDTQMNIWDYFASIEKSGNPKLSDITSRLRAICAIYEEACKYLETEGITSYIAKNKINYSQYRDDLKPFRKGVKSGTRSAIAKKGAMPAEGKKAQNPKKGGGAGKGSAAAAASVAPAVKGGQAVQALPSAEAGGFKQAPFSTAGGRWASAGGGYLGRNFDENEEEEEEEEKFCTCSKPIPVPMSQYSSEYGWDDGDTVEKTGGAFDDGEEEEGSSNGLMFTGGRIKNGKFTSKKGNGRKNRKNAKQNGTKKVQQAGGTRAQGQKQRNNVQKKGPSGTQLPNTVIHNHYHVGQGQTNAMGRTRRKGMCAAPIPMMYTPVAPGATAAAAAPVAYAPGTASGFMYPAAYAAPGMY